MRKPLTAELLRQMYTIEGMSDSEIAETLKYDRTAIVRARQRHNIPTRLGTGRLGELLVLAELKDRFGKENVIDMNEKDATSPFDILLNGNKRIEVKSSMRTAGGRFTFSFANSKGRGILVDEITKLTASGGTVKDLSKSCDYVILVFIDEETDYFILPSYTPDMFGYSTKSFGGANLKKYSKYFNQWNILERSFKWEIYLRNISLGRKKKKIY